jgi:hypothetical protein
MQERKKLRKSGRAGRTWRSAARCARNCPQGLGRYGRERGRAPFRLAWSEGCAVRVCLVFAAGVIALTAFATWAFALDRQALWSVVNACVADHKLTRAPFPCLKVFLGGGKERGYVVLYAPFERDTILAPTRKILGVEDPYLQSSAAPQLFRGRMGGVAQLERRARKNAGSRVRARSQLRPRAEPGPASHSHGLSRSFRQKRARRRAPRLAIGEWSPIGPLVPHQPFWAFRTGTADLGPETMGTATKVWHPCRCAKADRGAP